MLLVAAALLLTAGCATGDEWVEWQSHPSHFASGQHFDFSMGLVGQAHRGEPRPDS
jgi:hypothetical protein